MKAEELKGKTTDELKALELDLRKKQFNLRFQLSQGQLNNTAEVRSVRRDIARVRTFIGGGVAVSAAPAKAKAPKAVAEKKAPAKPKTAKKAPAKPKAEKKKEE